LIAESWYSNLGFNYHPHLNSLWFNVIKVDRMAEISSYLIEDHGTVSDVCFQNKSSQTEVIGLSSPIRSTLAVNGLTRRQTAQFPKSREDSTNR